MDSDKPRRRGRGEGSIEHLPSGNWRAVISLGADETKKRRRITKTFPTKGQAQAWKLKQLGDQADGRLSATSITLGAWLTTWLAVKQPDLDASTYKSYAGTVAASLRGRPIERLALRRLSPLDIERWLVELATDGKTQTERWKAALLLKMTLKTAVERDVLARSPAARVKLPRRPDTEALSLTLDQLAALLVAAEARGYGLCFELWADAGVRIGELLAWRVEDFTPASREIRVRWNICTVTGKRKSVKTKSSRRTILLSAGVVTRLATQVSKREPGEPLFPTARGTHWWSANFRKRVFNKVAKAAGIQCTPHVLRHTCATLLLQVGGSLKAVSQRLGHKDPAITLRTYAHVMPSDQEKLATLMEGLLSHANPTRVAAEQK